VGLATFIDPAAIPALVQGLFIADGKRDLAEECRLALARIGPPAIPPLLELLGSDEEAASQAMRRRKLPTGNVAAVRGRAAQLLGDLRAGQAVRPLAAALRPQRKASFLSLNIVRALGLIGTSAAVDPLLGVLRDPGADLALRVAAADAVSLTGDEFAVPVLFDLVAGVGKPRDQPTPWMRTLFLWPLVRVLPAERAPELRALYPQPDSSQQGALDQAAVAETCHADLDCYIKLIGDKAVPRAEKAAWAIGFSGDRAGVPALLGALGYLSDLPAVRYPVYWAALHGLARLADQSCQPCREKLTKQIAVDDKLVRDVGEKKLLRETRLVLAYLEHKVPPPPPSAASAAHP
jgi:HEAT repeat protein